MHSLTNSSSAPLGTGAVGIDKGSDVHMMYVAFKIKCFKIHLSKKYLALDPYTLYLNEHPFEGVCTNFVLL